MEDFTCKICGKVCKDIKGLSCHVSKIHKDITKEEYYLKYIALENSNTGICNNSNCQKPTVFDGFDVGFRGYCSIKCMSNSDKIKQKTINTNMKKYGTANVLQNKEIKEKIKSTNLEKYGTEFPSRTEEVKDKMKKTNLERHGYECNFSNSGNKKYMLEKYGVENPSHLKGYREKYVKTCIERFGVDNPLKSKEIRDKIVITCTKKFGVSNPAKSEEIKEKIRNTNTIRYGFSTPLKNKEIKEKIRNTVDKRYGGFTLKSLELRRKYENSMLNKYDVINPAKSDCILEKIKKTNLIRYGVENPSQNLEIDKKRRNTNLRLYGNEVYYKSEDFNNKYKKIIYNRLLNSDRLKKMVTPLFSIEEYIGVKTYDTRYKFKCNKCNNEFLDHLMDGHIPRCKVCYPTVNTSISEQDIIRFVKEDCKLSNFLETHKRGILKNYGNLELDLYIENKRIALEFDGLYWHSENSGGKNRYYHINKTKECENLGIKLIHIFEDEWIFKKDIVKSIIRAKLNIIEKRIFARNCSISSIDDEKARLFLDTNHIQGYVIGNHIGLFNCGELVSVLSYGSSRFNNNYCIEILRFSSILNTIVIGGLSKMLKFLQRNQYESVLTYVDRRFGYGNSYRQCGFKFIKESEPSYFYIKNGKRFNRMNFQKHLLERKLEIYDSTLTEWENMQLNNYDRIWDCGTISYGMRISNDI